jgi:uncharacterized protein YbjT (DUF2867 family)
MSVATKYLDLISIALPKLKTMSPNNSSPNSPQTNNQANSNTNKTKQESSNWDLGKFYQTLTYFDVLPWLKQIDVLGWLGTRNAPQPDPSLLAPSLAVVVGDRGMVGKQIAKLLSQAGYRIQPVDPFDFNVNDTEINKIATGDADAIFLCLDTLIDTSNTQAISNFSTAKIEQLAQNLEQIVNHAKDWLKPDRDRQLFDFRQASQERSTTTANASDTAATPDQSNIQNIKEIWGILDDVVMGGVSASNITLGDRSALFYGNVSTANSGGFASVRSRNFEPAIDLSAYEGIELRVRGDGKRYKFMLRDSTRWDGIAFCASFDTVANNWINVRIPFDQLAPIFRAKTVKDAEPIATDQICAFQLMLSKFEYDGALNPRFEAGSFRLEIEYIKAYSSSKLPQLVLVCPETNTDLTTSEPATTRDELTSLLANIENLVRRSGIPYTIIKPVGLYDANQQSQSEAIALQHLTKNEQILPDQAKISSIDVATVCLEALKYAQANKKTFTITTLKPEQSKQRSSEQINNQVQGNWASRFANLTPDIIRFN